MNSWEEVGTHIVESLKRLESDIQALDAKVDELSLKVALRVGRDGVIAGLDGGTAGLVVAGIAIWTL